MREWLSGGAPPCQGGGRGFDPRLALLFLRRRQAKVPDSCLHEMKALWRPPDIEHEMRDGGGDAGWVVWRLAAYYPLFLGTGIGPARGFGLRSAPVGAKRTSTGRPAPHLALLFFAFFTWLSHYAAAFLLRGGGHQSSKRRFMTARVVEGSSFL